MGESVYINGRYLNIKNKVLSIEDPGFLYGDGVFETIRGYKGRVFALDLHLERLFNSLKTLKYNPHFTAEEVSSAINSLISKNGLSSVDIYIKIIISRSGYIGKLRFDFWNEPNLVIIVKKLDRGSWQSNHFLDSGVKLVSSSIKRSSMGNDLYRHKLLNYFENIFAKNEAYAINADEAVFLTKDRVILEGATSNIFIVKCNKVLTPPVTLNILPGVTREIIIKFCRENRISFAERRLHYYNILEADEVFITNSIIGIAPVAKFDSYKIGDGMIPGIVTKKLINIYMETAGCI